MPVLMPVSQQLAQVSPNFFQAPPPPSHSTSLVDLLPESLLVQKMPCELEHLKFSLDQQHLGGAIISAIQLCKAWTALITLKFDVSDDK
jgi:hypothetical protein